MTRERTVERTRPSAGARPGSRAARGLVLVFVLSFINLIGVLVTAAAIGGVAPWSRWQFIGLYGVLELASGLANVITPNVWRLPVAELRTSERTDVKLAASALLLPHWGGLARAGAGLVLVSLAAWQEGVGPVSALLVAFIPLLACSVLAVSAIVARAGVEWPEIDVVQFVVRQGTREKELSPISIGASVFQFALTVATIPAAKLLPPTILFRPELGPSAKALFVAFVVSAVLAAAVYVLWIGRIALDAPREQQREAEEHG